MYKTRNQATAACRLGQVRLGGAKVKASRLLRIGDELEVQQRDVQRRVRVLALLERRVGAKLVVDYMEDLTSDEAWAAAREAAAARRENKVYASPVGGRPSKRQRRLMDEFLDSVERSAGRDEEES